MCIMSIDTHMGWGMLARNLDPLQGGIPVFLLVSCCPFIIPFLVPPRFISPLRNTSVLISTTMNLTCTVTADPEASIRWFKDDSENIPGAIYSQGNAILILKNVTLTDEGWYKCLVKNRAGNATSEAYIEITVPPQVSLSHEILKLRRHEKNVTVDCYGSGKPRPAVTWKRGQNDVPVFAVITTNETNQVPQNMFF